MTQSTVNKQLIVLFSLNKNNLPLPGQINIIGQYFGIISYKLSKLINKSSLFLISLQLNLNDIHYRLYPIPMLDNRPDLHRILDISKIYCKKFLICVRCINEKLCFDLSYPTDSDTICKAQLLKPSNALPRTCHLNIIFVKTIKSEKQVYKNHWLITVSRPLPVTIKCPNKEVITKIGVNSLLKLQQCSSFIDNAQIQVESY